MRIALLFALAGCTTVSAPPGEPPTVAPTSSASATEHPAPQAKAPEPKPSPPAFLSQIRPLSDTERNGMQGVSMHPGCPVGFDGLVVLELSHWGLDGTSQRGELVVGAEHAEALQEAFGALYAARFPIERMRPVRHYGGSDDASMVANNTSAFNCRTPKGGGRYSDHAYGRAVDINPFFNPWVRERDGVVQVDPPSASSYADRTQELPGLIRADDATVDAFRAIGWTWGGTWRTAKDYQHFSATGL